MMTAWLIAIAVSSAPASALAQAGAPPEAAAPAPDPAAAERLVREGQDLYRKGSLGEALLKFEEAIRKGAQGGDLFYQTGFLLKTVRQDAEGSRQYMTKAVPLLEKAVADPGVKSPAPFYYLSAALGVELGEAARAVPPARQGAALADKGVFKGLVDGESLFQIGRLYTLAGEPDKAIPLYEKAVAALDTGKVTNRQYLVAGVEQLSSAYMKRKDYDKGILWLNRLIELEPGREQDKLMAGIELIKGARHQEAIRLLRGFTNDAIASEANYIVRILTRYVDLGAPAVPADKTKLDDAALLEETRKSAQKLAEIRQKEEEAENALPAFEIPYEWHTGKKGMKMKVPIRPTPPPGWQPKDPNNPTQDEQDIMNGVWVTPKRDPVPPGPERVAAEKEFFGLLVEDLRRGHFQRERGVIYGFSSLIFR